MQMHQLSPPLARITSGKSCSNKILLWLRRQTYVHGSSLDFQATCKRGSAHDGGPVSALAWLAGAAASLCSDLSSSLRGPGSVQLSNCSKCKHLLELLTPLDCRHLDWLQVTPRAPPSAILQAHDAASQAVCILTSRLVRKQEALPQLLANCCALTSCRKRGRIKHALLAMSSELLNCIAMRHGPREALLFLPTCQRIWLSLLQRLKWLDRDPDLLATGRQEWALRRLRGHCLEAPPRQCSPA